MEKPLLSDTDRLYDLTEHRGVGEKLWEKVKQSREQKHRRLPEAWKQEHLKECMTEEKFPIRFEW